MEYSDWKESRYWCLRDCNRLCENNIRSVGPVGRRLLQNMYRRLILAGSTKLHKRVPPLTCSGVMGSGR